MLVRIHASEEWKNQSLGNTHSIEEWLKKSQELENKSDTISDDFDDCSIDVIG